ncbi:hypothetical protein L6V77_17500 [Myxococcota bacterium]|nr:hypothetical protein [Myxococcota bacterium]
MANDRGTHGGARTRSTPDLNGELQARTVSVRLDPARLAALERLRTGDSFGPTLSDIIRNLVDERLRSGEAPAPVAPPSTGGGVAAGPSRRRPEKIVTDHFERLGRAWQDVDVDLVQSFEDILARQDYPEATRDALRREFHESTHAVLALSRHGLSRLDPIALTFGRDGQAGPDGIEPTLDLNALLVDPAYRSHAAELGLMEQIASGLPPGTGLRAHCRAIGIRPALWMLVRTPAVPEPVWTPEERERLPLVREWLAATGHRDLRAFLGPSLAKGAQTGHSELLEFVDSAPGRSFVAERLLRAGDAADATPDEPLEQRTIAALVAAFATSAWRPSSTGGAPRALCGPTHFHGRQGAEGEVEVVLDNQKGDVASLGARIRYVYSTDPAERAIAALRFDFRRSYAAVELTATRHRLQRGKVLTQLELPEDPAMGRPRWRIAVGPSPSASGEWPSHDGAGAVRWSNVGAAPQGAVGPAVST